MSKKWSSAMCSILVVFESTTCEWPLAVTHNGSFVQKQRDAQF